MDRETLLEHRQHWGKEEQPERRDLPRLSQNEAGLYDDLRQNRLGQEVRLEQEKIGYLWVQGALGIVLGCHQTYEYGTGHFRNPETYPENELNR